MRINLSVTLADGKKEDVVCTAPDLVRFEDKFNVSVAKLENEMKLTHLFFLAHASLTRTKRTTLSFEDWLDTIEGIAPSEADPK
jgi:hypothetical protein